MVEPNDVNSQIRVHGRDGPYLMDKSKWPQLKLPVESKNIGGEPAEELTQEDSLVNKDSNLLKTGLNGNQRSSNIMEGASLMDEEDVMDRIYVQSVETDMAETAPGWQAPKSKKKKKKTKRCIAVATRTSSRVPRDGVPIAEKAAQRAKIKNESSEVELLA